ncbi:MAG: ComEC family competence protein [Leptolyngbyaceae cyanobacterium SM2_5_2]|nr:ComEC family competence protein [Leptolyngbyaceae cyanobacterium SM2_5_2]
MGVTVGLLGGIAYCLGLFVASLWIRHGGWPIWSGVGVTSILALLVAGVAALLLPRVWLAGPRAGLWLGLGAIGLLAAVNYGWQYPTPSASDISHWLSSGAEAEVKLEVGGQIETMPKLTRSGNGQFWLKVDFVRSLDPNGIPLGAPKAWQGKLYVTVPGEAIPDLYAGQRVEVSGKLYAPTPPKNPNAFNFQQYLADHHCYAGLRGQSVRPQPGSSPPRWALWRLRGRIAKAHAAGLGERAGALVSAMALDRRAVQLPYDLQDTFIQAGLAHALAASGFHVSLLLGVVLGVMAHPSVASRLANPGLAKLVIGSGVLAGYVLLTGGQPSIMRAAFMGVGALIGMALERGVKPLGCLLLAATLLLLWNPIWIDDVGFRLSVMATFGLIVGVKPLTERLEWLPTTFTTVVAVSLTAYFWTIPLSLYYFNTLTTYSILLNIVVTPLLTVISLGGIFSGLVAVVSPGIASMLAWLLWLLLICSSG